MVLQGIADACGGLGLLFVGAVQGPPSRLGARQEGQAHGRGLWADLEDGGGLACPAGSPQAEVSGSHGLREPSSRVQDS